MLHQQLYELQKKTGLIKGKKTQERSRSLEARVAMLEAKTDNSSNESVFADEKPIGKNRNNPALDQNVKWHQTESCRYLMVRAIKKGQSAQCAKK